MTEHAVRIDPVRRHYNQWVRNQILEDYALRFTATRSRRWSCGQVANTAIGAGSFLALEAIGAAITLQYGFVNAALAIATVSTLIFLIGLPIAYHAARAGVDIDLLTRGAGFGYLGSTVTSLIYASFTFIFFALEAAIMATALELWLGVPLSLGYLLSSFLVIPIVLYGITLIGRFQRATQPLWVVLQLAPFLFLAWQGSAALEPWHAFAGLAPPAAGESAAAFDLIRFGAASAVVFSLVAQIGEQVDYLRFLPERTRGNRLRWWAALVVGGPGWIVIGAMKMLAGSFLVVFAIESGLAAREAAEPVRMYLTAWSEVLPPNRALLVTALFVIVCQLKINVTNAYAGSIAWSNFFSRLTRNHPGRVVWVVFNVAIALLLMELGVYHSLEHTLSLYSIVAVAWVGALAAGLTILPPLGLSPGYIEFRRAHLHDVNPVGTGAMLFAAAGGLLAYGGFLGESVRALAGFATLGIAVVLVPLLALWCRGRFWLAERVACPSLHGDSGDGARGAIEPDAGSSETVCRICEHAFEANDMTGCPAYGGPICSLCCTLDSRCEDRCRPGATVSAQVLGVVDRIMPVRLRSLARSPIARYLALLSIVAAALALLTTLVYLESTGSASGDGAAVSRAMRHLFVVLLIVAGVFTWIFLLISDSRRAARRESDEHNRRLLREIEAHERTERALKVAKETAEAANQAKSRYLLGLGHELRSPLNAIMGYSRLMIDDPGLPSKRRGAVRVIHQSSEHLAGLIESLLDISKIEAGRFAVSRERIALGIFLAEIADMFRLQASARGLGFRFDIDASVPALVHADGSRLRQVLINLLSNAIKYTDDGGVCFAVRYRSQLAEFSVSDTGIGIAGDDLDRIFEPFETVCGRREAPRGTGLGLTITKLLAEVMGGDIAVRSEVGVGSVFTVRLLLSSIDEPLPEVPALDRVIGHDGPRRCIVVVDDDPAQRALMADLLRPRGFDVHLFEDAESCLAGIGALGADACLLDIALPGLDGHELAGRLRERFGSRLAIIMLSAHVDARGTAHIHDATRDNHFVKPIDIDRLLERLRTLLGFEWIGGAPSADEPAAAARTVRETSARACAELPDDSVLDLLGDLSAIGHVAGLRSALAACVAEGTSGAGFAAELSARLTRYDLAGVETMLRTARSTRAARRPHSATEGRAR